MNTNLALSASEWYAIEETPDAKNAVTLSEQDEGYEPRRSGIRITGELPSWFSEVEPSIVQLFELSENWDSYGARPIDDKAVAYAVGFLLLTMNERIPSPSIVPVSTGGVQVEWHTRGIDLEVEIEPSGRSRVAYGDQRLGTEWEGELEHNPAYAPGRVADFLRELAERA